MATQGLISITRDGKVVAKIVTGCNGKNIPTLAESLRKNPTIDPQALLNRAHEHDLGGASLIVQVSPDVWISDEEVGELSSLYKDKFYEPRFNPRWDSRRQSSRRTNKAQRRRDREAPSATET